MNKIYFKNTIKSLLIAIVVFIFCPAAFVAMVDPCQIFHKPLSGFFKHGFYGLAICQNAGLINTYLQDKEEGYDSILVGTSLSGNFISQKIGWAKENHDAEIIEKLFSDNLLPEYSSRDIGWKKTLKLTAPSTNPLEQKITLERALSTGNVRHVFWEVYSLKYLQAQNTKPNKNIYGDFPAYLYNKSRLDDYNYIFNMTTVTGAFSSIAGEPYANIPDIDKVNYWENNCKTEKTCTPFKNREAIEKYKASYTRPHITLKKTQEINAMNYSAVDQYLLPTLMRHCNGNTGFDLFIPPTSLFWLIAQGEDNFNYHLYFLRYIVSKTTSCKNIRVYAFYNELWITGDLAHYSDGAHYFGGVQDYIIDSMITGKHIITMDNIAEFEKTLVENVNNYTPWASTAEELRNSNH
jgi:hypothetical protein